MAEYRLHWIENHIVRYSWHRSRSEAIGEMRVVCRRLGLAYHELNEKHNVVRFDLNGGSKCVLLDFLNEHCAYGPDIGPLRRTA